MTWVCTKEAELVEDVLASAHRYVREHGAGTLEGFQPCDGFFAPFLNEACLFHLAHSLAGRDADVEKVLSFLRGDRSLLILVGPPGIGKSKLLYEAARRADPTSMPPVRFHAGPQWRDSDLDDLPAGPVCVVIDDAHRRQDLEHLTAACLRRRPGVRFLVSSTPGAVEGLRAQLRHLIPSNQEGFVLELKPLEDGDAQSLAGRLLSAELQHLASRLVEVSAKNPLILTAGAALVSSKRIAPELLAIQADEFRSTVLDRFLDHVPARVGGGPVDRDAYAQLLAALGPGRFGEVTVATRLAERLAVRTSHFLRALDVRWRRAGAVWTGPAPRSFCSPRWV